MLTKLAGKGSTLLFLLANPRLLKMKISGLDFRAFQRLDQPWLLESNIRSVVDIGANVGQFARLIRTVLPQATVYSFEPLPDCFAKLQARLDSLGNCFSFNSAIGDQDGSIEFYRSRFSPSSSARTMASLHREIYPASADSVSVQVPVATLDSIFQNLDIPSELLIKVDTQGYEDKVIKGGKKTFSKAKIIIIEVAFQELYENQPSFDMLYHELESLGFKFMGMLEQVFSPIDGALLFADCIFVKENEGGKSNSIVDSK